MCKFLCIFCKVELTKQGKKCKLLANFWWNDENVLTLPSFCGKAKQQLL